MEWRPNEQAYYYTSVLGPITVLRHNEWTDEYNVFIAATNTKIGSITAEQMNRLRVDQVDAMIDVMVSRGVSRRRPRNNEGVIRRLAEIARGRVA